MQDPDKGAAKPAILLTEQEQRLAETIAVRRQAAALWVYDFQAYSIRWANPAALVMWSAESCVELAGRDLRVEMSDTVEARLQQYCEDFQNNPDRVFHETWTVYPRDEPVLLDCTLHWCPMPDGRACTLIEGVSRHRPDAETQRAMDALMHSDVLTALYDSQGKELYANRALRDAIGPGSSTFGQNFVDPDMREMFSTGLEAAGRHRNVVQVHTVVGVRWFDIRAVRCRDSATGDQAFLIDARDVTAEQAHQAELMAARDQAREADRAKSEFIATMSHEMRTPMNGVLGMIELLSHSNLTAMQTKQLQVARESGVAMLALIEDVLDLSSVELNAVRLDDVALDVPALANSVVDGLRRPAHLKDLGLSLSLGAGLESPAHGDGRRLAQVMRNLISNAIKFTAQGSVALSLERDLDRGLLVTVSDTGPGVPLHQREAIFDKFRQGARDGGQNGGVGLGLAICKEIVTLMGGRIGVQDAPGGGAQFWFSVPEVFSAPLENPRSAVVNRVRAGRAR